MANYGRKNLHRHAGYGVETKRNLNMAFMTKGASGASSLQEPLIYMEKVPRGLKMEIIWRRKHIPVSMVYAKIMERGKKLRYVDAETGHELKLTDVMPGTLRKPRTKEVRGKRQHLTKAFEDTKTGRIVKPTEEGRIIEVYDETGELLGTYRYTINKKTGNPQNIIEQGFEKTSEIKITNELIKPLHHPEVVEIVSDGTVLVPIPITPDANEKLYELWKHLYENKSAIVLENFVLKQGFKSKRAVIVPDKTSEGFRLLVKVGGKVEGYPILKRSY